MARSYYRDPDAPDDVCGQYFTMWDGEYESHCVLPPGHEEIRHWDRYAAWDYDTDDIETNVTQP